MAVTHVVERTHLRFITSIQASGEEQMARFQQSCAAQHDECT